MKQLLHLLPVFGGCHNSLPDKKTFSECNRRGHALIINRSISSCENSRENLSPGKKNCLTLITKDQVLSLCAHLLSQPGPGKRPVTHDRARGDFQHLGGLVDTQAAKKAQLDNPALTRIDLL